MRQWGYAAPPEELARVTEAADAFRRFWEKIRPPFPCDFAGTADDTRALDYLLYEGLGHESCGIERAALVCGEVLRKAAGFEWFISYRGDWMVAGGEHANPSFAVCPLARLHEAECGAWNWGKHAWVVEQAALSAYRSLDDPSAQRRVAALLREIGTEYRDTLAWTTTELQGETRKAK